MTARLIIGVDPGAAETGVVVRRGDDLVSAVVIDRRPGQPLAVYLASVLRVLRVVAVEGATIAVEDVTPPNPHMGMIAVGGLIGTAAVLGAVLGAHPGAVVVPAGGNGSGPLCAYPPSLRPTRGKGAGYDRLRHARSAWDIAGGAAVMLRTGAAS
ncbi:MAG: hypothetical protein LC792_00905 [Actinobacteria bacterium]|nr:hypothetical protein [Actinomycetota bacterium]